MSIEDNRQGVVADGETFTFSHKVTVGDHAKTTLTANDIQHGGTHYKVKAIQPWDYIAANNIGFLEGNAIKYLTRWKDKGGVEDIKKAMHYVQKLLEINS